MSYFVVAEEFDGAMQWAKVYQFETLEEAKEFVRKKSYVCIIEGEMVEGEVEILERKQ